MTLRRADLYHVTWQTTGNFPPLALGLDLDVDASGDVVAMNIVNRAARYVRADIFHALPGPPDQQPLLESGMDAGDDEWTRSLMLHLGELDHVISANEAYISALGVLPIGAGIKRIPLPARWIGRYRIEVVGMSGLDAFLVQAPPRYHEPRDGGFDGYTFRTSWATALFAMTVTTQVFLPILGYAAGLSSSALTKGLRLLLAGASLRWGWLTQNSTETGVVAALWNFLQALRDLLGRDPELLSLADRRWIAELRQLLGSNMNRVIDSVDGFLAAGPYVAAADFALALGSIASSDTTTNFFVEQRAAIEPRLPLGMGHPGVGPFDLSLLWMRYPDLAGGARPARERRLESLAGGLFGVGERIDGRVVLSDLYGDLGAGLERLDLTLEIEALANNGGPLVDIEFWDPRRGPGPVAFELAGDRLPWLVSRAAGQGSLTVTARTDDPLFPYPALRESRRRMSLWLGGGMPFVSVSNPDLSVGEQRAPDIEISFGAYGRLKSDEPFEAILYADADGRNLRLEDVLVHVPDRWNGGETSLQPLPAVVEISVPDDDPVVLLEAPDPSRISIGLQSEFAGLGACLRGRREGLGRVAITLYPLAPATESGLAAPLTWNTSVRVHATVATVALTGPALEPEILIEDDWEAPDLFGSFRIRVQTPTHAIYDSAVPALIEGRRDGSMLYVHRVYAEDDRGERHQLPLTFALRLVGSGRVGFAVGEGDFFYEGTFDRMLVAIGGGGTETLELRVQRAVGGEEPFPLLYDFEPSPARATVRVPSPLQPEVREWIQQPDASSPNRSNLSTGWVAEIIFDRGTLTGTVAGHRTESRTERILLRTDTGRELDLLARARWSGDTFALDVDALHVDENALVVSAWKPINEVTDGGPSEATARLRGVRPNVPPIDVAAELTSTIVRTIPSVTFRWGRAISAEARVRFDGDGTGDFDLLHRDLVRYADTAWTSTVTLRGRDGNRNRNGIHWLSVHASNDFGSIDRVSPIHAMTPAVRVTDVKPLLQDLVTRARHAPNQSGSVIRQLARSAAVVDLMVEMNAALEASVDDVRVHSAPASQAHAGVTFVARLPPTPGDVLDPGDNTFVLAVSNEFARVEFDPRLVFHQRFVVTAADIRYEIRTVDLNDASKWFRVTEIRDGVEQPPFETTQYILALPRVEETADRVAAFLDRNTFQWLQRATDAEGNPDNAPFAFWFEMRGTWIDEDWLRYEMALELPPAWVVPSSGNQGVDPSIDVAAPGANHYRVALVSPAFAAQAPVDPVTGIQMLPGAWLPPGGRWPW